jgi:cytochrome P450
MSRDVVASRLPLLDTMRAGLLFARDPIAMMSWLVKRHGPVSLLSAPFAGSARGLLFLSGGPQARAVLSRPELFRTSGVTLAAPHGTAHHRLRQGIIRSGGAEAAHYRGLFNAQMGKRMMERFAEGIAHQVGATLPSLPHDQPVDLAVLVRDLVAHFAAVTLFREEEPGRALAVARAINDVLELGFRPAAALLRLDLPGLPYRRLLRAAEAAERLILVWAATRAGCPIGRDLLSTIVNAPAEDNAPLATERVAGHVLNLYAASYDTSTASLTWTLFLLMQHPEIATALAAEVAEFDPIAAPLACLDFPLLDQVVKEALRLFTPVPYQLRVTTAATELFGVHLPAKSRVLIGAWTTNRAPAVYPDPDAFRPERWAGRVPNAYDWLTFSAGPRRCIGFGLAMIMIKVTLAMLLRDRCPRLVAGTHIDTRVAVTVRPAGAMPLILAPSGAGFERVPISGRAARLFRATGAGRATTCAFPDRSAAFSA